MIDFSDVDGFDIVFRGMRGRSYFYVLASEDVVE